jgi:hypothetical protein
LLLLGQLAEKGEDLPVEGLGVLQEKEFQEQVETSCPCWGVMAEGGG